MTTKLNQILAVEKGAKAAANREFTDLYHLLSKSNLWAGISRTYRPKDDDGDQLPPESTNVQMTGAEVLARATGALTRLFDITATKEWANTQAAADIVVDGRPLRRAVPVTYLLFLEKQLTDLHTFIAMLPTLDPAQKWEYDAEQAIYRSEPVQTVKTKKVPRNHVLAEATDKHPAQVQVFHEDVPVGYWTKTDFSGAISPSRKAQLLERVDKLLRAVKYAREEANGTEVTDQEIGEDLLGWLFE